MFFANMAHDHGCLIHTVRSWAVKTAHAHGRHFWRPREYEPSESAGAIVSDIIIILYLQDACNSMGYQHGHVNTNHVHGCPK